MRLIFLCLVLHLSSTYVFAYRQELILIDSVGGKVFTFYNHVPDISEIPGLENINRVCVTGVWTFYGGVNYTFGYYVKGSGGPSSLCEDTRFAFKSFRFGGAEDTETEALSLYTSHLPYQGAQIYIEESPFAGINVPIKSLSSTGQSAWTLFEGSNFDGKSYCWAGAVNSLAGYNFMVLDKLPTIGSVVKGCPKGGYKVEEFIRVKLREFWHQAQLREQNRIASENNQKKNHNQFENGKGSVNQNSYQTPNSKPIPVQVQNHHPNSNSNSNFAQSRPIVAPKPTLGQVPILVESPVINVNSAARVPVPTTTTTTSTSTTGEPKPKPEAKPELAFETESPANSNFNKISNSNPQPNPIEEIRDIQPAQRPAFICYFISCKAKNIII